MKKFLILLALAAILFPVGYIFIERNRQIAYCEQVVWESERSDHSREFLTFVKSNEWDRYVIHQIVGSISVYQAFVGTRVDGKIAVVFGDVTGDLYNVENAELSDGFFSEAEKAISERCSGSIIRYFDKISDPVCHKLTISEKLGAKERLYISPFASPDNCPYYKSVSRELRRIYSNYRQNQMDKGKWNHEPIVRPLKK